MHVFGLGCEVADIFCFTNMLMSLSLFHPHPFRSLAKAHYTLMSAVHWVQAFPFTIFHWSLATENSWRLGDALKL